MNYNNMFSIIILFCFSCFMFYLDQFTGLLEFLLMIIAYTIVFFGLYLLWKKIRKKISMCFYDFAKYFLNRISVFLLLIVSILGWISYYYNEKNPAPMPEYTISDWDKTIIFQWMSHIWTQKFYDNIVTNLTKEKKDWAVYFYEGVWPGSEENIAKFNKALWVKFDHDLYDNFSKLYWVVKQDQRVFMNIENDFDFNVDLTMDEIVEMYEKIPNKEEKSWEPLDISQELIKQLASLNDRQLKILVYINRAILNLIIWSEGTQDFLQNNFSNKDLFDVILNERNKVLSKAIIESKYDKIYITYGLLHFRWVMKILKQKNNNWKIVSIKNLYPIKD